MSWDKKIRGGKARYYYRSKRIKGRCVKVYLGRGLFAEMASLLDQREREDRKAAHDAWMAERVQVELADLAVVEARNLIDLLRTATLILEGCYFHHGFWRRRRGA